MPWQGVGLGQLLSKVSEFVFFLRTLASAACDAGLMLDGGAGGMGYIYIYIVIYTYGFMRILECFYGSI